MQKSKRVERNKIIYGMRAEGKSYAEIGVSVNITRQRVEQIVKQLECPPKPRKTPEQKKERINAYSRKLRQIVRLQALKHYGGETPECICCGEKGLIFLCFDHINGGGNKHRKTMSFSNLAYWLRKNNYPSGFQILCYNCNNAKKILGSCPHKQV